MNPEVLRNTGGRGARSVTVVLQGEGRGNFFPKSALRDISMAPRGFIRGSIREEGVHYEETHRLIYE